MCTKRQKSTRRATLLLAFAALLVPQLASSQALYGSVTGVVRDTSGAALPGATVTLVNVETGFTQTTVTNAVGSYTFANVLEGSYDVQVTLESFREFKRTGVPVSTGNVSRADAVLEIGQLTETVTVSSDAELLQTDTTDVRQEIKSEEITNIPLDNYRNYQSLLDLVPGTTPSRFQNAVVDTPSRALQTNSNGMNPNTNSTRVDGARNLYTWLPHHTLYVPSAETIESVNVSTASMGADAGMSGGASVTVVTKSGTNELKGSAYGRFNNEDLNASSYFTHDRSPTRHTIAAGALGGPLKRNTLFFFGAWEGQYQRNPSETFYDVPPLAMRNGDLGGALNDDGSRQLIYDPATGDEEGRGRLPFPNNVIPSERLNPIARRVQEFYPEPNWDEDSYVTTRTDRFDRDQLDLKINWNRSATHQIWGKLGATDAEVTERFKLGFEDGSTGDTRTYAASVGQTWTLGPTLVLDSTLGYSRLDQQVVPASYGENWGSEIFGIPGTNGDDVRYSGMPVIETGFHLIGVDENWMPLVRDDPTWTFSTNLTKSTATHNLKVGFRLDHLAMNHWQPEFGPPRGRINAANTLTSLRDGPQTPNRYNEYAAFLLGHVESFQKSVQWEEMTTREWQMGLFVSDRWNLGDRLTLNLGLRWEYYPLMTRQGRGVERLDFATMDMLLGGVGGNPTDLGIDVPLGLFSPNLGLAYRITENTVFRTGYGLNYDPLPFGRPLRGSFPLTIAYTTEQPNAWTHAGTIDEGIPTPPDPNLASGRVPVPGTVSIRTPDPENVDRGYIQSWNVSVERRLPWETSLNLAYVGSKHTGGFADRELNWSPPGGGTEGRQLYEEFGRTASTDLWGSFTEYNYHSLQVAVNRRFTNGLHIRGAYTWSKAMNMTDEDGWAGLTWNSPAQFERNYALAGYDRTHNFQVAWVYDLPFGKNGSGVGSQLIRNWWFNGHFAAYSGSPLTITANSDELNAREDGQTARQVGELRKIGDWGQDQYWYDPSAWESPRDSFGNTGRNSFRGPAQWRLNLGVFRTFDLGPRYRLQVRAEAFDGLNTPCLGNPASTEVDNESFMEIHSLGCQRRVHLGARFTF